MTRQNARMHNLIMLFLVLIFVLLFSHCTSHGASAPYATGLINDPDGANIRSTYSTEGSIVGGAPYQGSVIITKERFTSSTSTAKTTRWYYVQGGYGNGWIRSDLLDVSYGSIEGKTTDSLNIRKGAGTSFDAVTSLNEGDTVDVRLTVYSSTGYKWYKIYYNQYYRFVRATYVELQEPEPGESGEIIVNGNFSAELAQFPSSYHTALKTLHEKYPSWHFKANVLDFTWSDALAQQRSNYAANTIPSSKPDSYKLVSQNTYDFDEHYYYGLDGSSWVAASKKAVAYYMDPRNWLDEINVFMFESLTFDPASQTESMVKGLLAATAIPQSYSSSYMTAGVTYNISPVYLAAKSRLELGSSSFMVDGHQFTYGGKTYKGYYNAYNIGASDSANGSAALKGLYYAASGTSYLRPWNTLDKAIRGGAKFIAEDFVGNNQHTAYYEHFNVANTLDEVGTHVYMTNTMAAATHANITYWDYSDNDLLDTAFTFEIPVYQSMTTKPAAMPGSGNNNCYLDTLKVYNGDTRLYFKTTFDRFTSTYTLKTSVGAEVDELMVKTTTNASDAKVKITGNTDLKAGENKITVKVTSSSGIVKNYYINVTKLKTSSVVVAPEITLSSDAETGKPVIKWAKAINADEYKVYRSTSKTGTYTLLKTTTALTYTDTKAKSGTKYYYKVKSVGTSGVIGSAVSTSKYRTCDLPQPVISLGNRASDGNPQLKWEALDGAVQYEIYRSDSKDGTYEKMKTQKGTSYTNTLNTEPGQKYYYKVKAIHENTAANSAYSIAKYRTCDLPQPVVSFGNREPDGKPQLKWQAVDGAASYEVYRAADGTTDYVKMLSTTNHSYTNTSAKAGESYKYKVKAIHKLSAANSAYSSVVSVDCLYAKLVAETGNRVEDGKPQLKWNKISGAEKYEVYRATSKTGTYKKMFTTAKQTYTNTSTKAGSKYYYKVKAIGDVSEDGSPIESQIVYRTCDLPQPVISIGNRASDGNPQLKWNPVEGAVSYVIYRGTQKDGTFTKMHTQTGTVYTNSKSTEPGKKYYYKVKAICQNTAGNSAYSEVKYRICDLPRPSVSLALRSSDGKPKLTWDAVEGAEQYVVYYSTTKTGTFTKLATKTGTSCSHLKAVKGKTYYYKVKAVHPGTSSANSAYSLVKGIKSK